MTEFLFVTLSGVKGPVDNEIYFVESTLWNDRM